MCGGDDIATHIGIMDGVVTFKNYTDDLIKRAFGIRDSVALDFIDKFFENRCFPRTRKSAKRLLKELDVHIMSHF